MVSFVIKLPNNVLSTSVKHLHTTEIKSTVCNLDEGLIVMVMMEDEDRQIEIGL